MINLNPVTWQQGITVNTEIAENRNYYRTSFYMLLLSRKRDTYSRSLSVLLTFTLINDYEDRKLKTVIHIQSSTITQPKQLDY